MKAFPSILATVLMGMPFVPGAIAFHAEVCSAEGATPLAEVASGVFPYYATVTPENGWGGEGPGSQGAGYDPVKFTFTTTPGQHYLFGAHVVDASFVVCVPGAAQNRHSCSSSWPYFPPLLLLETCSISIPGSPGWGSPIVCSNPTGCSFVLYLFYCSGVECGYPADVPAAAITGVIVRYPS